MGCTIIFEGQQLKLVPLIEFEQEGLGASVVRLCEVELLLF